MLIRHCTKYLARFTKPKLSKYKDVFEIMAQRDQSVSAIE